MRWQRITAVALIAIGLTAAGLWMNRRQPAQQPGKDLRAPITTGTNRVAGTTNIAKTGPPVTTPAAQKLGNQTNAPRVATSITPPRTNRPALAAPTSSPTGTNAPAGKGFDISKLTSKLGEIPTHYYIFGVFALFTVALIVMRLRQSGEGKDTGAAARVVQKKAVSVSVCNVVQLGPPERRLWQFSSRSGGMSLSRTHDLQLDQSLPSGAITKDWRSLAQSKLNVAWLPPEHVFLRVIHLPASTVNETLSMVELQLEKISPMPVAQVVWSIQSMPHAEPGMQTAVVVIVARSFVEEFLGKLESEGFLADRLELPLLDQLQATSISGNGAWLYPVPSEPGRETAFVAWWYGGVLRDLGLVMLSPENPADNLREQLTQMMWAGEMEGWLSAPPTWNLAASGQALEFWQPLLKQALEQEPANSAPLDAEQTATLTATRAARSLGESSLLPPEYATRYQQQFVDRLWMGALGAAVGIYLLFLVGYFIAVQVALYRTRGVEQEIVQMGPAYTNATQLKAQYQVFKDRQELKYASLDCWRAVSEQLPEGMTLDNFTFTDGKRLTLQGSAPMGTVQQLYQFESTMRKTDTGGQPLFEATRGETLSYHTAPGGGGIGWTLVLELKRSELQ